MEPDPRRQQSFCIYDLGYASLNVLGANIFRIIFPDAELMGVMALDVSAALPRRDSFAYRRPGPGSCERWGWGA